MSQPRLRQIIEQDWDDIAIDDGTVVDTYGGYEAVIFPRDDTDSETFTSSIDSIRYREMVNSAPAPSFDVEPMEELEGTDSDDYIAGVIEVFLNSEPLFAGEITKINTSQTEGDFYTIKARSPGRLLRDDSVNISTENDFPSDIIANVVDNYNEVDAEHVDFAGTSDESFTGDIEELNGQVRRFLSDNSSITISNVGEDASNIDIIYVKIQSVADITFTVETDNSSYERTFTDADYGDYGDWVSIEPTGLDEEEYGIAFESDEGSLLYDWISITDLNLRRKIDPPLTTEMVDTDITLRSSTSEDDFRNIFDEDIFDGDDHPVFIENDRIKISKTALWDTNPSGVHGTRTENDGYIEDKAESQEHATLLGSGQDVEYGMSTEYEYPEDDSRVAIRIGLEDGAVDNMPGDPGSFTATVYLDSLSVTQFIPFGSVDEGDFEWFFFNLDTTLDGSHDVSVQLDESFENVDGDDPGMAVDVAVVYDNRYVSESDFDNSIDSNYRLSSPGDFPEHINFIQEEEDVISNRNIAVGKVEAVFDDDSNTTLQMSFDSGETWIPDDGSESNTSLSTVDSFTSLSTLRGRFAMGAKDSPVRDDTPSQGYESNYLEELNIKADVDDAESFFNSSYSGNRLSVISNIADDSLTFFRWEGNQCLIFKRGDRETDIDLRSEDITSEIDAEDVYSSVEVIGSGGVSSDIIESDRSPDYINRHKEIRDPDIETEAEASIEAVSFLDAHDTVEYNGSISTLPTRAPVGEEMDGSLFNHGRDSFIEEVNYGKRRTSIDTGRKKRLSRTIVDLNRDTSSSKARETLAL